MDELPTGAVTSGSLGCRSAPSSSRGTEHWLTDSLRAFSMDIGRQPCLGSQSLSRWPPERGTIVADFAPRGKIPSGISGPDPTRGSPGSAVPRSWSRVTPRSQVPRLGYPSVALRHTERAKRPISLLGTECGVRHLHGSEPEICNIFLDDFNP